MACTLSLAYPASQTKAQLGKDDTDNIIEESKEHCQETIQLLGIMDQILKDASQSDDPKVMRIALDGVQKPLGTMREHLALMANRLSLHKSLDQQKKKDRRIDEQ
jgi:hypothetical protein